MQKLNGKVALVTGGASGLGKDIAQRLAADGASVVITDVQSTLGRGVADELGFTFLEQDVADESRWREVTDAVIARHGGLHVLVNNAGLLSPPDSDVRNAKLTDWRRVFAVNVEGVFLGCRAALEPMKDSGGGSIINISSIAAFLATPTAVAYGAGKAAVRHLTKSIAQYCAENKLNIRCNSVHPGMIRTPSWDKGAEARASARGLSVDTIVQKIQSAVPMGDFTLPRDVAAVVAFLASDDSRHMTGAPLVVDGGLVYCDTFHMDLTGRR